MSLHSVTVADPGKGLGGPPLPLFLDQTEARWAEKNILEDGPPPSHFIPGSG